MADTSLDRASLGNVMRGALCTESDFDGCEGRTVTAIRGHFQQRKHTWFHICTHQRCGWWPQTERNSSLSRCPSPASSLLPEEEEKTGGEGFKDCVMGLEHQQIYLDGWQRGYLVDLISSGVFPHSHGQRSFIGHRYPQLHIGHAVKVLDHRGEKAWSGWSTAENWSLYDDDLEAVHSLHVYLVWLGQELLHDVAFPDHTDGADWRGKHDTESRQARRTVWQQRCVFLRLTKTLLSIDWQRLPHAVEKNDKQRTGSRTASHHSDQDQSSSRPCFHSGGRRGHCWGLRMIPINELLINCR